MVKTATNAPRMTVERRSLLPKGSDTNSDQKRATSEKGPIVNGPWSGVLYRAVDSKNQEAIVGKGTYFSWESPVNVRYWGKDVRKYWANLDNVLSLRDNSGEADELNRRVEERLSNEYGVKYGPNREIISWDKGPATAQEIEDLRPVLKTEEAKKMGYDAISSGITGWGIAIFNPAGKVEELFDDQVVSAAYKKHRHEPIVGKTYWFEYHCWESEESADAELWHHTHQKVLVYGRGDGDYDECPVCGEFPCWNSWKIRFPDGYEHTAAPDELLKSRSEFERPDYKYEKLPVIKQLNTPKKPDAEEEEMFRLLSGEKVDASMEKRAYIVKRKDGYHVLSEKGKNLGGPYKTREQAVKRLRQVEYFKHHGSVEFRKIASVKKALIYSRGSKFWIDPRNKIRWTGEVEHESWLYRHVDKKTEKTPSVTQFYHRHDSSVKKAEMIEDEATQLLFKTHIKELVSKLRFRANVISRIEIENVEPLVVHVVVKASSYEDVPVLANGKVVVLFQSLTDMLPKRLPDGRVVQWVFESDEKVDVETDTVEKVATAPKGAKPCLMVMVPKEVSEFVKSIQDKIPEDMLGDDGIPDFAEHITVLFDVDSKDINEMREFVKDKKAMKAKVIGYDYFDNDDASVLHLVVESEALTKLHNELRKKFDNDHWDGAYKPHITIAYLKPKARFDVLPEIPKLDFEVGAIEFSDPSAYYKKHRTLKLDAAVKKSEYRPQRSPALDLIKAYVELRQGLIKNGKGNDIPAIRTTALEGFDEAYKPGYASGMSVGWTFTYEQMFPDYLQSDVVREILNSYNVSADSITNDTAEFTRSGPLVGISGDELKNYHNILSFNIKLPHETKKGSWGSFGEVIQENGAIYLTVYLTEEWLTGNVDEMIVDEGGMLLVDLFTTFVHEFNHVVRAIATGGYGDARQIDTKFKGKNHYPLTDGEFPSAAMSTILALEEQGMSRDEIFNMLKTWWPTITEKSFDYLVERAHMQKEGSVKLAQQTTSTIELMKGGLARVGEELMKHPGLVDAAFGVAMLKYLANGLKPDFRYPKPGEEGFWHRPELWYASKKTENDDAGGK
jgi:2'-5' RNA ligase